MTEDEAKTRWCPMTRAWINGTHPGETVVANRVVESNHAEVLATRCQASKCMMFRWLPDATAELSGNPVHVDAQDADLLEGAWWDGRYARNDKDRLHRIIAARAWGEIPQDRMVDHRDGDTRNNRRGNLRIATKIQNAANSAPRGGASQYRGVYKARSGRWVAQITSSGVRQCLGTFDTEIEAASAYDEAAKTIHGDFARPNLLPPVNSGRHGYCGLAGKP